MITLMVTNFSFHENYFIFTTIHFTNVFSIKEAFTHLFKIQKGLESYSQLIVYSHSLLAPLWLELNAFAGNSNQMGAVF